ncbi:MAG: hypothetical protein E6767_02260 [Dysgonomonas sp.]|nr:hypothetical protein [Dysgonomonas sp.]
MKANTIHNNLLNAIKEKLPAGSNIANKLMDILCLGREAIYRRLRSEVVFTLEEASLIATSLGISLDEVLGCDNLKSRPLQIKLTSYIEPTPSDYLQMDEYIAFLKYIIEAPDTEVGYSGNSLAQNLFFGYKHLTLFMVFRWQFQSQVSNGVKYFKELKFQDRFINLQEETVSLMQYMPHTYHVWDFHIIQYLVNDIKHFVSIRLISQEELSLIKKDLFDLLDDIERIASKGKFDTGKPVQLYISNINFDSTYSYMQSPSLNVNLGQIWAFSLNSVISMDATTTSHIKNWILSQKRVSTLISESGEIQRILFFKTQRQIIDTL